MAFDQRGLRRLDGAGELFNEGRVMTAHITFEDNTIASGIVHVTIRAATEQEVWDEITRLRDWVEFDVAGGWAEFFNPRRYVGGYVSIGSIKLWSASTMKMLETMMKSQR